MVVPRRFTRRRSTVTNPIQSYKQITVDGPASRAAATNIIHTIVQGTDDYSGPLAGNNQVPTGAHISSVLVMLAFTNLVSVSALVHLHLQCFRSGSGVVTPGVVGGNALRNQVIATRMFFIGKDQNNNLMYQIKIPKIYQRIREGDSFALIYRCDAVFASATQAIYKFYR